MNMLTIELKKEKRADVILVLLGVGVLGAAYEVMNFLIRKDTLLNMPKNPMDVLLTQVYGMVTILNMFGIVVSACIVYNMEFSGNAIKKMYMLPVSVHGMYLCKFLILTAAFLGAVVIQNIALAGIGQRNLPEEAYSLLRLVWFAGYSFITSMPVLSFMILVSSLTENLWISLGIGVAGFLSGMALATSKIPLFLIHPFVVMLKPAVAMSADPSAALMSVAILESLAFLAAGVWIAKKSCYE